MEKKILGIIPARCGSKSIPNKNVTEINGKPLIAYTIEHSINALKNNLIDELIVSTDCEKIKNVAERYGAKVPFLRPKSIANDQSRSIDFVKHAIDFFENKGIYFSDVIILQPTSPLRTLRDIETSIDMYKKNKSESLISCYLDKNINENKLYYLFGNKGIGLSESHFKGVPRQLQKKIYIRNGAIFLFSVKLLISTNSLIGKEPLLYIMEKKSSIDIDSIEDLNLVKDIITNK